MTAMTPRIYGAQNMAATAAKAAASAAIPREPRLLASRAKQHPASRHASPAIHAVPARERLMNEFVARKAEQDKAAAAGFTPFTNRIRMNIAAAQTTDAKKLKWIRLIAICRRRASPAAEGCVVNNPMGRQIR